MPDIDHLNVLSQEVGAMFLACHHSILQRQLIHRESRRDKEFPFQNWFKTRLEERGLDFDEPGRNTYPDFRLGEIPLGYELKGLGFPGRVNDYDCNSQIPQGQHDGYEIIYVFGRYPAKPDRDQYPILDLVLCHGAFLNADNRYVHRNKSVRGMGSFGDVLLRDRKMYVAPTPFGLLNGIDGIITLILPASWPTPDGLAMIGKLMRSETNRVMTGYHFDLNANELYADHTDNPSAGQTHHFCVYSPSNDIDRPPVTLR